MIHSIKKKAVKIITESINGSNSEDDLFKKKSNRTNNYGNHFLNKNDKYFEIDNNELDDDD